MPIEQIEFTGGRIKQITTLDDWIELRNPAGDMLFMIDVPGKKLVLPSTASLQDENGLSLAGGATISTSILKMLDGPTERARFQYESNNLIVRDESSAGAAQWWISLRSNAIDLLGGNGNDSTARLTMSKGDFYISDGRLDQTHTRSTTYSAPPQDAAAMEYKYDGTGTAPSSHGGGPFAGAALRATSRYGQNASPVGNMHAISATMHVYSVNGSLNEVTPVYMDLSMDAALRGWGTDQNIFGPVSAQADLILGQSILINNYNSNAIPNGGWGSVLATAPTKGGGDAATDRSTRTTYALNAALAIIGYAGPSSVTDGSSGSATVGWTTGIQIGSHAGGWIESGISKIGTGIAIQDYTTAGLTIVNPFNANSSTEPIAIKLGLLNGSDATYRGQLVLENPATGANRSRTLGIEFKASNASSGYGFRITCPDLGSGNTPLSFENRGNSASWTEVLRIGTNGNIAVGDLTNFVAGNNLLFLANSSPTNSIVFDAAGGVPGFVMKRSDGTQSSRSIVADADVIMRLQSQAYNGSAYNPVAEIDFEIDGTPTSGQICPTRMVFKTTQVNTSQAEALRLDAKQNVVQGTAGLSTSATDGFLYIESCAGAPTGTPTSYSNRIPLVYDRTNNKLYAYNVAWKNVTLA